MFYTDFTGEYIILIPPPLDFYPAVTPLVYTLRHAHAQGSFSKTPEQ